MEIKRNFDLLEKYKANSQKEDALCFKQNGVWKKFSAKEYVDLAYSFCYGLYEMGFRNGDKIITISNNRPEWNFVDLGMAMLGVVHVPVFTSLNVAEYEYVIKHSEAKMVIISDVKLFKSVFPAVDDNQSKVLVYTFDEISEASNWMEIVNIGKSASEQTKAEIEKIKIGITEDAFATLIYTSGTTGQSKGVMLSHKNLVSNFLSAAKVFNLKPSDKYLSILPLCHVGGRLGNYQTQYSGAGIYYAENMGTIAVNMQEIRPDGFDAVPRIIEKFYEVIISKGKKLDGVKKKLFFWAVKVASTYKPFGENGWFYERKLKLADKLIFSKWRAALGNNVRIVGCGGASLPYKLERIFWAAGIKIVNMYGLTETSPIITINRTSKGGLKLGSVGKTIEGVEVKIAEDGEILCKGPNVMIGYYKEDDLTKAAFDEDGWFKTGDIGHVDKNGFLMVTDRKKEIFKLSNGKFIAPQLIEIMFKESALIDQLMIVGEHEKFAAAIISPNFKYFEDLRSNNEVSYADNNELIENQSIISMMSSEVEKMNKALNPHEKVVKFKLVTDEWTPATGELSPTLKLRRQVIAEKYSDLISQIYKK
ncbi:MAG: long-chain fatty acid--CoA ligase [Bacteroidetes bacterium]|nr:long-chain fatty acid--CoA ligase [Bacteroidota bacterium]